MPLACGRRKGEPTIRSRCIAKSQETASGFWTPTIPFVRGQNLPAGAIGRGDEKRPSIQTQSLSFFTPRSTLIACSQAHWWPTGSRLQVHRFEPVYESMAVTCECSFRPVGAENPIRCTDWGRCTRKKGVICRASFGSLPSSTLASDRQALATRSE
jgi:hypothetical protein